MIESVDFLQTDFVLVEIRDRWVVGDRSIWSVQETEPSPPSSVTGKNTSPRSDVEKMQALAARRFELSRTHACDICGVVRSEVITHLISAELKDWL